MDNVNPIHPKYKVWSPWAAEVTSTPEGHGYCQGAQWRVYLGTPMIFYNVILILIFNYIILIYFNLILF